MSNPPLGDALATLDERTRAAFLAHLDGYTSAQWLADTLTEHGIPTSPTSVKRLREQRRKEFGDD